MFLQNASPIRIRNYAAAAGCSRADKTKAREFILMPIKVKDLNEIRSLISLVENAEEGIKRHSFDVAVTGYSKLTFAHGSAMPGVHEMHQHIVRGLREYRKTIIARLKELSMDVDLEEPKQYEPEEK